MAQAPAIDNNTRHLCIDLSLPNHLVHGGGGYETGENVVKA